MKAWKAREKDEFYATIVFAETRGKAKVVAMMTDECAEADFIDIEIRRAPQMDKYYKEGKTHTDWFNTEDRIALVKECGFECSDDAYMFADCKSCPAKEYCDKYNGELKERENK